MGRAPDRANWPWLDESLRLHKVNDDDENSPSKANCIIYFITPKYDRCP